MAIFAPWLMLASMSRKAAGLPDISRPTSKPSVMPSFFCTSGSVCLADVHRFGDAHLARQFQTVGVHVGDHHVARAGVPRHGRGHDADGSRAGDQHVLAQHRKRKRRVHGVAEGIENGGDIEVDAVMMPPDVGHGQRDVFGERAGPVHAHALRVRAQVAPAGQAIAAAAADHVAFAADDIAGEEIGHVGADLDDLAHEFVADHQATGMVFCAQSSHL